MYTPNTRALKDIQQKGPQCIETAIYLKDDIESPCRSFPKVERLPANAGAEFLGCEEKRMGTPTWTTSKGSQYLEATVF